MRLRAPQTGEGAHGGKWDNLEIPPVGVISYEDGPPSYEILACPQGVKSVGFYRTDVVREISYEIFFVSYETGPPVKFHMRYFRFI